MAKRALPGEKMEEVNFTLAKSAFKGPYKCHGETKVVNKNIIVDGNTFAYGVWKCSTCKKEYLDTLQAKRLEAIWTFEKIVKEDISMKRSINYDGKMFFIRFPKELTKSWSRKDSACIKMIDAKRFIVEVG